MSYRVIKASEIAEYVYCSRAWWLRVEVGYSPMNQDALSEGATYHRSHGSNVVRADTGRRIALGLLFLAVTVIVFWLIRAT